jgi:LDH2 family malate/lactate/ureidoglycolate dehydrogenase
LPNVTTDQFRNIAKQMFEAAGATDREVNGILGALEWASLHGHDTHGVGHFPMYVKSYMGGGGGALGTIKKGGEYRILNDTPATVSIDADWCNGHYVTNEATGMVIEKAKKTGIAIGTVANCTHNGALGFYANQIVDNDMIALLFTCSGAASPPWGGVDRMLGTNPLAVGIPAKDEYPIIIDMGTSSTTWAGLNIYRRSGNLPPNLFLNEDGESTTDLSLFQMGGGPGSMKGAMANMGNNHKGYAMQLAVEMLGGVFPALMTGSEAQAVNRTLRTPATIIALNVSFFQDLDAFKTKVDERIREIKGSKKKADVDHITIPGHRGFETREKRLRDGMPIPDHYWQEIEELAKELNVDIHGVLAGAQA